MTTETPHYSRKPLGSVQALAFMTNTSSEYLHKLARHAPTMYRVVETKKAEGRGEPKVTYEPALALKAFQRQLIKTVLAAVSFPPYINGGVPGRSYRADCAIHTEAEHVVKVDIASFYESVSSREVRRLWGQFFNFPPEVAELLTALTTHNGHLPRGAPTSSYLANLLFWREEPRLHADFAAGGVRYSRYVDDISLSSMELLDDLTVQGAITRLYGMFKGKGIRPNREKQRVMRRPGALRVHNINVGGAEPTIPKVARDEIRAGLHNLERAVAEYGLTEEVQGTVRHLQGKIAWLKHFHPERGLASQQKLVQILSVAQTKVP